MKVSIISASGKIGTELTRLLYEQGNFNEPIDFILYAPNNKTKIIGNLEDLKEGMSIRDMELNENINFISTNKMLDVEDSDLVIICSGQFATEEEKKKYEKIDPSGRKVQSVKNYQLIKGISEKLKKIAPESTVVVVTNQSDIMTEVARKTMQNNKVFGIGCNLDTQRFKNIFSKMSGFKKDEFDAKIIGFHNKHMFIHEKSFKITRDVENIEDIKATALVETKQRGKEISNMQKDTNNPNVNSGSSKLPAAGLFNIISAFVSKDKPAEIILNRPLQEGEATGFEGLNAQLPCMIKNGQILPQKTELTLVDIENLDIGITEFSSNFETISRIAENMDFSLMSYRDKTRGINFTSKCKKSGFWSSSNIIS